MRRPDDQETTSVMRHGIEVYDTDGNGFVG
jgi:hypothetical protein